MRISLSGVGLSFGRGSQALSDLSLDIQPGERLAIIGPSGAGKTSLLRILGTALRPSSGRLNLDGAEPWSLGGARLRALRGRIGTVHQAPPLPPRQRLVTAVLAGRLGAWGLLRSLGSLLYPADIEGARAALARVGMDDRLFDRCDQLSGGQLQRVGVARVLYQQPDLLLADEPVSALDPELAHRTIGELNHDASERGATLVASLHAVDLALGWFPRIVGVRDGAIQFDLPPDQVKMPMLSELYRSEIEPSAECGPDLSALTCRTLAVSRPSFCR